MNDFEQRSNGVQHNLISLFSNFTFSRYFQYNRRFYFKKKLISQNVSQIINCMSQIAHG